MRWLRLLTLGIQLLSGGKELLSIVIISEKYDLVDIGPCMATLPCKLAS